MLKHVQSSKAAQHCQDSLSFTSVSSTKSVCGSESWGAQGGSALTVEGNSFRKYQTARHTHNPQSRFLLNDRLNLLFSVWKPALVFLTLTRETQAVFILSGMMVHYNWWRSTTQRLASSHHFRLMTQPNWRNHLLWNQVTVSEIRSHVWLLDTAWKCLFHKTYASIRTVYWQHNLKFWGFSSLWDSFHYGTLQGKTEIYD